MVTQRATRPRQRGARVHRAQWRQYVWTPGDGATYCLIIGPAPAASTHTFISIGRADTPLISATLALDPWPTFGAFVDTFAANTDVDVQLLWAGWRGLCVLGGLPDPVPPAWLPAWRSDWYSTFAT